MHVSVLRIYPVKSAGGLDVSEARVLPEGLEGDRRWMVVDPAGTTVTARTRRRLLWVTATPSAGGAVELSAPGRQPLRVEPPVDGPEVTVTLSRVGSARAASSEADEWLSDHLQEPVRLVWLDDPRRRPVSVAHGGEPGDPLTFADAGPVLVTTTTSLTQLDAWMAELAAERGEPSPEPLPMIRFRPNIVVDAAPEAFAEDEWKRLWVGDVEFRFAEHCDRCVLPTIDPVTLAGSKEPTRTLARHRQWNHEVHFGIRMIPLSTGVVRRGDQVAV